MATCKVLEKCPKCQCCSQSTNNGLASQISVPRPTERVIERQIVERVTKCETCDCENEPETNSTQ